MTDVTAPLVDRLHRDQALARTLPETVLLIASWGRRLLLLAVVAFVVLAAILTDTSVATRGPWMMAATGLLSVRGLLLVAGLFALLSVAGCWATWCVLRLRGSGRAAAAVLSAFVLCDLFGFTLPILLAERRHPLGAKRHRMQRSQRSGGGSSSGKQTDA